MNILELALDPNSLIIKVDIPLISYLKRFSTPSSYFRKFAHSNSSIGRRTNKAFFKKYVEGGGYRADIQHNNIKFIFIFKLKPGCRTLTIDTSIILRFKKLVDGTEVHIGTIQDEENEDKIRMFTQRNGQYLFQSIGELYERRKIS
jgi:hypothetical protein